jgi:hypothetical protein
MVLAFVATRRRVMLGLTGLFGLVSVSKATEKVATTVDNDAELLRLGRQFEAAAERINFAMDNSGPGQSYYDQMLSDAADEYEIIHERISSLRATTWQGLQVKARVATWASAGKMYPEDSTILIDPIALSLAEDVLTIGSRNVAKPTEFQYSAVVPRLWRSGINDTSC